MYNGCSGLCMATHHFTSDFIQIPEAFSQGRKIYWNESQWMFSNEQSKMIQSMTHFPSLWVKAPHPNLKMRMDAFKFHTYYAIFLFFIIDSGATLIASHVQLLLHVNGQLSTFRHVSLVRMTSWSSNPALEGGKKTIYVTLNEA